MARFLSEEEIRLDLIPTARDIGLLAKKIADLPGFGKRFVIFGSVAWTEEQTWKWRSDIDMLQGALEGEDHQGLEDIFKSVFGSCHMLVINNIIQQLPFETGGIETTGCNFHGPYPTPALSPSTRDHFNLLAKRYKGPWKRIIDQIKAISGRKRIEDIEDYIQHVENKVWRDLSRQIQFSGQVSLKELIWMSSIENFPKQLMRKILGWMKRLPNPDTFPAVQSAFQEIEYEWAQKLHKIFSSFWQIEEAYENLIAEVRGAGDKITETSYSYRLKNMFKNLPVVEICKIVHNLCRHYSWNQDFDLVEKNNGCQSETKD